MMNVYLAPLTFNQLRTKNAESLLVYGSIAACEQKHTLPLILLDSSDYQLADKSSVINNDNIPTVVVLFFFNCSLLILYFVFYLYFSLIAAYLAY